MNRRTFLTELVAAPVVGAALPASTPPITLGEPGSVVIDVDPPAPVRYAWQDADDLDLEALQRMYHAAPDRMALATLNRSAPPLGFRR